MPKSKAFKTESGYPTKADCDACALMFRRLLAKEFRELPFEYNAGPYRMGMEKSGELTMTLATAECLLRNLA